MRRYLLLLTLVWILLSCSDAPNERPVDLHGDWYTVWRTLPESFAGIDNITSFEMNGQFIFTPDSVTIIANGFEGCVFGIDTLSHTQGWKVGGDTLYLISEGNVQGITYRITDQSQDTLQLQLMKDIFLTLTRQ